MPWLLHVCSYHNSYYREKISVFCILLDNWKEQSAGGEIASLDHFSLLKPSWLLYFLSLSSIYFHNQYFHSLHSFLYSHTTATSIPTSAMLTFFYDFTYWISSWYQIHYRGLCSNLLNLTSFQAPSHPLQLRQTYSSLIFFALPLPLTSNKFLK